MGPPESPEHTELDGGAKIVCKTALVTADNTVLPARKFVDADMSSRPQPAIMAVSPTTPSRLVRIETGVRPRSSGTVITATSKLDGVLNTKFGQITNDCATISGSAGMPSHTRTMATPASTQCAAVRIDRGPMIVPVQLPTDDPSESRILSRTTGERAGSQTAPFRMARPADAWPNALQASDAGIGAFTVGEAGEDLPQAATMATTISPRREGRTMTAMMPGFNCTRLSSVPGNWRAWELTEMTEVAG